MNKYEFAIITNEYHDSKNLAKILKEKLLKFNVKENILEPDIVFVLGGDGTFLKTINKYNKKLEKVKFVTFNQGKIGFYHNFLVSDFDQILQDIFNDESKLIIKELDLLEVENNNKIYYAVNEVRLINFAQTLNCNVIINNELLQLFRGTGIIVSTKTGSAGLMKTTGAAVILAKEKLIEMQELFPVSNNLYRTLRAPIILDQQQIITLKINQKNVENINNQQLIVDTFIIHDKLKEIKVKLSNLSLKIFAYKKQDESLIKKLNKTFIEFDK